MGIIHFQPARKVGEPEVRNMIPEASAVITLGAPLARDGTYTDQVEEHAGGSTVTGILGVAMAAVPTAGTPNFGSKIPVAIASKDQEFMGQIYDSGGGAVATIPGDGTYEGKSYGIVEVNGNWYLDEDDTSNVVAIVTKELPEINAVLFKFIASAIAE